MSNSSKKGQKGLCRHLLCSPFLATIILHLTTPIILWIIITMIMSVIRLISVEPINGGGTIIRVPKRWRMWCDPTVQWLMEEG